MDPLFNEVGIYSATGQRYEPVDSELVLKYREAIDGQVLEEGITEAGSAAGFQAAGTSYATHGYPVIPFYIFYSMFGFQRTGDQLWAAGDARARGFLMGATAGRTTLTGEGLQHDDGHSHVLAMTNPAVRAVRPDVRLRARRDHPRRHRADARQGRGPHLLHLDLQRELPAGGQARGRRRGHPARHLPLRPGAEGRGPRARAAGRGSSARARSCSRSSPPRRCSPSSSASPPRCTRDVVPDAPPRRARSSIAGTGCTRPRRRAPRTSRPCSGRRAARSSPRPTG